MADSSTAAAATPAPVSLFYSYAHEDEALRDGLQRTLKILEMNGMIAPWHDRAIVPGQSWNTEIHQALQACELVLLLLGTNFLASEYIQGVELKTALQRAADGSATVVPILLRPLDLGALEGGPAAPLLQLQGLPRDLKAVTTWRPRDAAWVDVSKGLRATVAAIQARRAPPPSQKGAGPSTSSASALANSVLPNAPLPSIEIRYSAREPADPTRSGDAATPAADPLLEDVLSNANAGILTAQRLRNCPDPDAAALRRQTMALLGASHLPRLLWVDDQPEGNTAEAEMLARLQIEVVQVRSTDEALALLRHDREGFDLVVSDWSRRGEPADAGLRLQQAMQHLGLAQPVVIYHGEFDPGRRQRRADAARRAGVFGEAVVPMELLGLVQAALERPSAVSR